MTVLAEITRRKRKEVEALKGRGTLGDLRKKVARLGRKKPVFEKALRKPGKIAVIAEIKKRSPSAGVLRKNFDPAAIARGYKNAGAAALSVLTDEKFFGGSSAILKKVRKAVRLPILRKDFIVDEHQVWESRLMGADAILLIAAILPSKKLAALSAAASAAGLEVLFEVHTRQDLKKVLPLKPRVVGINNRDLRTFKVDIRTTAKLAGLLPKDILLISESGIQKREDLLYLKKAGAQAILVGESLMKAKNPGEALRQFSWSPPCLRCSLQRRNPPFMPATS